MEADSVVYGLIRHLASFLAAWLVKKGYVEESLTEAVIGTVLGLSSMGWSIYNKHKTKIAINTALQLPPEATKGDLIEALKAPEAATPSYEEEGQVLADEAMPPEDAPASESSPELPIPTEEVKADEFSPQ